MIYPKQTKEDYVLGSARSAPFEVINESGEWRPYLPEYELQRKEGMESNGCTNFGSLNILEILENYIDNRVSNYSERFTAVMSGQTQSGNDPHKALESMRKDGVIPEKKLPFTSGMSFKEYLSPKPMTDKLKALGKKWEANHVLRHEYIYSVMSASAATKKKLLTEALKRSPVGVSVYAWQKRGGVYIKPKGARDNHWVVLVAVENGKPVVFDSYAPHLKTLSWEHFDVAKGVYYKHVPNKNVIIELLQKLIRLLKLKVALMEKKDLSLQVYNASLDYLGTDASPRDYAIDELGCAESLCGVVRDVLPNIPHITGTWTLWDYMQSDPHFEEVKGGVPMPGNIILYATGTGNGKVRGHVGVVGKRGVVMSNDSGLTVKENKGKWLANMTLDGMHNYYGVKGGMPRKVYRVIK